MKIEFVGRKLIVSLRRGNAEDGLETVDIDVRNPPAGYKWIRSTIFRRAKSGRAVNIETTFVHCDRRVDPMDEAEARDYFTPDLSANPHDT